MLKFLVWHALVSAVLCELFAPEVGYYTEYAPTYDQYRPRDYHFDYAVSDPHTGDHKSQWEVKQNGVVRGGYSLLEPDGTTRLVEYIADDHGFRAVVKKIGTAIHPVQSVAVPVAAEPVVPVVPEVAHYGTYDGQIGNYVNLPVEPVLHRPQAVGYSAADVQPLVPIGPSYQTSIDYGTLVANTKLLEAPRPELVPTYVRGGYIEAPHSIPEQPELVPAYYGRTEPVAAPQPSGLLPISPSYTTSITYGTTGNLEDDWRYSRDDQHGDYSQKMTKVLPVPALSKGHTNIKRNDKAKPAEQFLIYYPDSESN